MDDAEEDDEKGKHEITSITKAPEQDEDEDNEDEL